MKLNLLNKQLLTLILLTCLFAVPLYPQTVADPPPYAVIANPLPDTMDHQKRDSVNLKFSRVRVNQAGYRPQDEKLFYYVGTSASSFSVKNTATGATAGTGTLTSLGVQAPGQLKITCYYKAQLVTGGAIKYQLLSPAMTGTVFKGLLPDLPEGKYKVVVGTDESAPFVIRADVYSMVKDALLKYYGVARCGNNDSWFHAGCHLKDPVPGGWHDAGDHIKVPMSDGYAFAVLGLCAAALQDRDADHYAKNQSFTLITDGIPDVLVEAKVGADFMINSYDIGGGAVTGMKTDIGDFGKDHGWWGMPEYQDAMGPDRGGPPRPAVGGLGGNTAGSLGAGLAFVGKLWEPYDATYAAKCVKIAKELYAYGKANQKAYQNAAMSGNDRTNDELALCALALWWATKDNLYKNDLLYDKTIGPGAQPTLYPKGGFSGGWFTHKEAGMFKSGANTSWADLDAYPLWGLYRLILRDDSTAASYGIAAAERLNLIEDILYCQISNISDIGNGNQTIQLPAPGFQWKTGALKYDSLWGWMMIQQDWMPNRYQAGNITELFCYYDIASKIQGTELPNSPASTDWKVTEVKSVLLKQLDYMLGMNPWDVSMIVGVGTKNLNHPHHRASDPELQNVPGAFYKYRPPVGALSAGYPPTVANGLYDEFMGGTQTPWFHTEISIDATTAIFLPVMGLAKEDTIKAPSATVRIVYVGCDSAVIEIRMTRFGSATVRYGTQATSLTQSKASVSLGVFHHITLNGLSKGTTYYFDVLVRDQFNREAVITDLDPDKNRIPFKFTTLTDCPTDAQIANVKICRVTHDSAEIFWYTPNGEFDSKVVYDTVKPPARWTAYDIAGRPVKFHYVKIGGLKEKTTYYFYVQSGATADNNNGQYYTFTTTVEHVNFDIRAVRYEWAGMPAVGINVINQDVKTYDSLDLRLYFRSKDGLENDFGARFDIVIMYQANGFQDVIAGTLKEAIQQNLRLQRPTKMVDTYNPADGTYAYYFSLPLWGVQMQSQSRIRLDVIFDKRSPWPPYLDLMNEAPLHKITNADWSFGPHSVAGGDPVDFPGIPIGAKDDVDAIYWTLPIDQYITVYRKGEYIWGFSPSDIENKTKKNYYVLQTQITSPLTNPSQDYVFFERTVNTVTVSGWATVTPVDGKINDIWVNGVRLANPSSYLQWNDALKRYDFSIPVPVTEGRNVVDIIFFAGPSDCNQCFGCANSSHHFFIEFRGAKKYPSTLTLMDLVSRVIPSGDTAHIDTTVFNIIVTDKNGNLNGKVKDTLQVTVKNPSGNDSIMVRLLETGDSTGNFQTIAPVSVVSTPPGQRGANQIFMSGGDRLWITYIDPTDPADSSQAYLITVANFPVPQRGWYKDANGDGAVDSAVVVYDKALLTPPDSLRVFFPDSSALRMVRPASGTIRILGSSVGLTLTPSFAAATTTFSQNVSGSAISWLTAGGLVRRKVFPMADSVGPILVSATVVERFDPGIDTLYVALSEAIQPQTLAGATFILIKQGVSTIITVSSSEALPNSYALVLAAGTVAPRFGDSLRINPAGPVADVPGNTAHKLNPAVPLGIKTIPASGVSGYYVDRDGNGAVDTAVVTFNKKVLATDLSLSFDWGNQIRTNPIGGASIRYKGADSAVIAVFIKGAFANAPLVKTSGEMYVTGRFSSSSALVRAPKLADSAAPVIDSALYIGNPIPQTGALRRDTLTVFYSEPVRIANSLLPYSLSRNDGTRYTFTVQSLSLAANRARFLVTALQGTDYPKTGDSIWIDTHSQTADTGGATQAAIDNRRALLKVKSSINWAITLSQNPVTPVLPTAVSVGVPGVAAPLYGFSATLRIYDGLGTIVLPETSLPITNTGLSIPWDGRNLNNRFVGSGTYLAVVKVIDGENVETIKKMLIGVKKQ